jgi:hypothetical protein
MVRLPSSKVPIPADMPRMGIGVPSRNTLVIVMDAVPVLLTRVERARSLKRNSSVEDFSTGSGTGVGSGSPHLTRVFASSELDAIH